LLPLLTRREVLNPAIGSDSRISHAYFTGHQRCSAALDVGDIGGLLEWSELALGDEPMSLGLEARQPKHISEIGAMVER